MKWRCVTRVGLLAAFCLGLVVSIAAAATHPRPGSHPAATISTSAPIMTVAGAGMPCSTPPACGDGGLAIRAQLSYPEGVAVGRDGDLYIVDWGDNEIRKVSPSGVITVVAGDGTPCARAPACGDGGPATAAQLNFPEGVAVDQSGNVYIADTDDDEIRKVTPIGTISRFAGTGVECARPPACGDGGAATAALVSAPAAVAVDRAGDVYIADSGDDEIRKVSPDGKITRVAGNGTPCSSAPACGDHGPATAAQLGFPDGVAVDQSGNVYVADTGDNEVRKVSSAGTITAVAGNGTACSAAPACGDGGSALSAELNGPDGVAVDADGAVYVADAGDNEIRRVSVAGKIETIAGRGSACTAPPACGDGGAGTGAQLNFPAAVAVDPAANVYVADTYDQEIRWLPAAPATVVQAASGKIALSAFATTVTRSAVTVRYALSGPAALALLVGSGRPASVVARASGHPGFGELSWNRRLAGRMVGHGRYVLTLTATVAGHSASTKLTVRL